MKFAIFENDRIEATPRAIGFCSGCGGQLLAKCGTKTTWHWAHKGKRHCDTWWEPETEWHRQWKNHFPVEWQEVSARDASGERHIADIKTPYNLVVEFQHSAIKLEEVIKRTDFYQNVIWIVDGTRRHTDLDQYKKMLINVHPKRFDEVDIYSVHFKSIRLLAEWGSIGRIVGFDFGGDTIFLLTAEQKETKYLFNLPKSEFIRFINGNLALPKVQFGPPVATSYRRRRFFR
jgi:competence protein CoiA